MATAGPQIDIAEATILLALSALAGCSPSGTRVPATAFDVAPAVCTVNEIQRYGLTRPNGDALYVEPQAIHPLPDGFLIAGAPTYEWRVGPGGKVSRVNDERFVGAFVRHGVVEMVDKPRGVRRVGWVRLAPLGGDRWAWLLEEVNIEGDSRQTTRIVYAESQGVRWTASEDLIVPEDGEIRFQTSSQLLATRRGLAWVVPFHASDRSIGATLYQREGDTWSFRSIALDWIDEVGLFRDPDGGLRVALGGLDEDFGRELVSLRTLPGDGSGTDSERVFLAEARDRVRNLRFVQVRGMVTTSWLVVGRGETTQWTTGRVDSDAAVPAIVDHGVITSVSVVTPDDIGLIVTHHVEDSTGQQELRVHHLGTEGTPLIAALPHPYLGYFTAVSAAPGELTIVGPEFEPMAANPFVRSLVLRLSVSCT